ncbi:MAG: SsrA-binding protein SmpB [Acidimicrobiales bacterium]
MAKGPKKKDKAKDGRTVVATNRRARYDYDVLESLECGIALRGGEVKSLREATAKIADAYAFFRGSELWLKGVHISPYAFAHGYDRHEPDRERKLLLHRHQLDAWRDRTEREQLTLIPLSLYFKDGKAKAEIALVRGRRAHDKRQVVAKRDAEREIDRTLAAARRGD